MWPKISYGLCTNDATYDELVHAMNKPYHKLCALEGLFSLAKCELRYLDRGFYGFELPHWRIEAMAASVNKIMTQYGCSSALGVQQQLSVELLTIKLRRSPQLFLENFDSHGHRVTQCHLKELWNWLNHFNVKLQLRNFKLKPPRDGDRWIMSAFEELGYTKGGLDILNRVRIHQEVLFESNIFGAHCRKINPQYLRCKDEKWSNSIFPIQWIPPPHICLWKDAISHLAPGGRRPQNFGKFVESGHKLWYWRYNAVSNCLYYSDSDGMQKRLYVRENPNGRRNRKERYIPGEWVTDKIESNLCIVEELPDEAVKISSHISHPAEEPTNNNFLEVLKEWGCLWL